MLAFFGLFRRLKLQKDAALIAENLHALEAHLKAKEDNLGLGLALSLHRMAEGIATRHGAALGVDVAPLSGGGPKEP